MRERGEKRLVQRALLLDKKSHFLYIYTGPGQSLPERRQYGSLCGCPHTFSADCTLATRKLGKFLFMPQRMFTQIAELNANSATIQTLHKRLLSKCRFPLMMMDAK
jgi:hypothetical protein